MMYIRLSILVMAAALILGVGITQADNPEVKPQKGKDLKDKADSVKQHDPNKAENRKGAVDDTQPPNKIIYLLSFKPPDATWSFDDFKKRLMADGSFADNPTHVDLSPDGNGVQLLRKTDKKDHIELRMVLDHTELDAEQFAPWSEGKLIPPRSGGKGVTQHYWAANFGKDEFAVELKVNNTKDTDPDSDDDFVIVAPATLNPRPTQNLTVTLVGDEDATATIYLTKSGTGDFDFEHTSVNVTVGTPVNVKLFGKTASSAKDATLIEARLQSDSGPMATTEDVTVIDGVGVAYEGSFECRLATNPDIGDATGKPALPLAKPGGANGWTRAWTNEPDFDRIVRFSTPSVTRSNVGAFVPVKVTKIIATVPANVEFLNGDDIIGKPVDLGSGTIFYGSDAANPAAFGAGWEELRGFRLYIGSAASRYIDAQATSPPQLHGATINAQGPGVTSGVSRPMYDNRLAALKAQYAAMNAQEKAAPAGVSLDERIQVFELYHPAGASQYVNTIRGSAHCGKNHGQFMIGTNHADYGKPAAIDKDIVITPRDSEVLKRFKNESDFKLAMRFGAYDAEALWGKVTGRIFLVP